MFNVYVFFGGIVEDVDFLVEWLDFYRKFGELEIKELFKYLILVGIGFLMFSRI